MEHSNSELARLYVFALWMIGERGAALERVIHVVHADPASGFAGWVSALTASATGPRGVERREVLGALDDLLRGAIMVSPGQHPDIKRTPRRLRVMQWELKRSCLFTVMRALSTGPRATFILIRVLGYTVEDVVAILGMGIKSVRLSLRRAEQGLDKYLGARCQHMAPGNSCRCDTRLGVALEQGLVGWPDHGDTMPDTPVFTHVHAEVGSLYRSLPKFTVDEAALAAAIASRSLATHGV